MTASGTGTIAHAGVVLPRLLADRVGLTAALAGAVARPGFVPVRHRGRALVDAAASMAAGASGLSDVEAWTGQVELFGPDGGASDTTVLRVLNELAEALTSTGLPGRRLARAMATVRARAWEHIAARHGGLPAVMVAGEALRRPGSHDTDGVPDTSAVPDADRVSGADPADPAVVVIRLDAAAAAASAKEGAEANYKGFGFHPVRREALLIRAEVRDHRH